MSRRRRKRQHARGRRKRPGVAAKREAAEKPQAAWVMVEHRDTDGNPTLPKELVKSTYARRYDQMSPGTEVEAHVLAGYKPRVMMIERKIYEIHRLSVRGWRRSGQIAVELEGWRAYEAEWFEAMKGGKVHISDSGLPGPHNDEADYVVSESSFDRKIVTQLDEQGGKSEVKLHHGTLDITETWKSAWVRQRTEVLNLGFKLLLAPLFAAVGAGLALLWMDRPSNPDGENLDISEPPVQYEDQATDGALGDEPSAPHANDQMPVAPSTQTGSDTLLESSDSATDRVPYGEDSSPRGGGRTPS